jgi:hypothetical protein
MVVAISRNEVPFKLNENLILLLSSVPRFKNGNKFEKRERKTNIQLTAAAAGKML